MRSQPKTALDQRNRRFGLPKERQRYPQVTDRMNVVWRQPDSYLKLNPGIDQTPLCTTRRPHMDVSISVVSIIAENLGEQLFGSRLVLFRSQNSSHPIHCSSTRLQFRIWH